MSGSKKNLISYGIKCQAYPSTTQRDQIESLFAGVRRVHNDYVTHTKQSSNPDATAVKESRRLVVRSLAELPKKVLEKAHQLVQNTYAKAIRRKRKPPQLKSRRSFQSAHFDKGLYTVFKDGVEFEGIEGRLRVCFYREVVFERVRECCLKRDKLGRYFVSFKFTVKPFRRSGNGTIGIDLGLKSLAVCSDGFNFKNPKFKEKAYPHLSSRYEKLKRKEVGSKNSIKALQSIRKLEEKIAQRRRHHFHVLTAKLIRENCVIGIEALDISRMMNHGSARKLKIEDAGWGLFRKLLVGKARISTGTTVVMAPPDYPSTQTCSVCEQQSPVKIALGISHWRCPFCNTYHDRDVNAARNLQTMAARWSDNLRMTVRKGNRVIMGDPKKWKIDYKPTESYNY